MYNTYIRVRSFEPFVPLFVPLRLFHEMRGGYKMREKEVEKVLTNAVKKLGGIALKFVSPGMVGVPDRLVLLPKGKMAFIELKAPGKQMRPIQIKRKRQLEVLGFKVYCIDRIEQIGGVLDEICTS